MKSSLNFEERKEVSLQNLIETVNNSIWDVVVPDDADDIDSPIARNRIKLKVSGKDDLDKIIAPIRIALEQLNAEELLLPNRISETDGAIVGDG